MIEIIEPSNEQAWLELRTKDITSTEVSALFGLSPYMTYFELWHRKKNQQYVRIEENERMFWGTMLQDAIAAAIAKKEDWTVRRMTEYIRNPEFRIGASFDFSIEMYHSKDTPVGNFNDPRGLLEIKNVDGLVFKNTWSKDDEGEIEAPLHIELQIQHQLLCCERSFTHLGALIGGNNLVMFKRVPDMKVFNAIKNKVSEFWHSIDNNIEPSPNFNTDADFLKSLYSFAEPGTVIDASNDAAMTSIVGEYVALGQVAKDATEKREALKGQLLTMIGSAEKVMGNGFTISSGMVGPAHVEYDRAGYRNLRVFTKKEKKS